MMAPVDRLKLVKAHCDASLLPRMDRIRVNDHMILIIGAAQGRDHHERETINQAGANQTSRNWPSCYTTTGSTRSQDRNQ